MINTGDYIVQQPYLPEDERWYVQGISLLDYGRFNDEKTAIEHKEFLEQKSDY